MTKEQVKEMFKQYAITVALFVFKLPYHVVNKNYAVQLNRAVPGAAANCRASWGAKSKPDFLNKFKIVEKELDELLFFSQLIEIVSPSFKKPTDRLYVEGNELLSIIVGSLKKLRTKQIIRKS